MSVGESESLSEVEEKCVWAYTESWQDGEWRRKCAPLPQISRMEMYMCVCVCVYLHVCV